MGPQRLVIFVKAPRVGEVKTRLAQSIGAEAACDAYRQLVELLLKNLCSVRDVELRFTPDDALADIQSWLREGWRAHPQGGGDLGERLKRVCDEHFAETCEQLVIIGSDCPDVTVADIEAAWAVLRGDCGGVEAGLATSARSPSPQPSPAGRGSSPGSVSFHDALHLTPTANSSSNHPTTEASQTHVGLPTIPPLPAGEGRGEGERPRQQVEATNHPNPHVIPCDLVLGPATDGGYWLIGLRAPFPPLFEGIHWSTDKVLAETLARAKESHLAVALLRALSDVDTAEDWERFLRTAVPE